MKYRTKRGDVLDQVCRDYYGPGGEDMIEDVLDANRGLAAHGAILPAGIMIELPDIEVAPVTTIRLWD